MRKTILIFIFINLLNQTILKSQPIINGIVPFYDKNTNTYLLPIEESHWNNKYKATITLPETTTWCDLKINGENIADEYIFDKIDNNAIYEITAREENSTIRANLSFTFLPIMRIEGDFGYEYNDAYVTVQMPGQHPMQINAQIKWRGGSTNTASKNKRNYKIKFTNENGEKKDYKLFGLRNDNNWILDAGQVDMFRVRNRIAADIWNEFASKPYYAKQEPEALSASRGQVIELFLNNQYQGIFNMCEPIDRKQMKLKEFEEDNGEIHGGLWKATGWEYATFYDIPEMYDNTKEKWNVFELKYPEVDDLSPSDYSTLYNAIKFVTTTSDKQFADSVECYFDIPVIIDWYIFCNVFAAFDICGKNIYWAVYDKQKDKRLTPAMWDLDCTMGQNFTNDPQYSSNNIKPDLKIYQPTKIVSRLCELNVNNFNEKAISRYHTLRDGVLSTKRIIEKYTDYYTMLNNSGAAAREEKRWSKNSDISGLTLDFSSEYEYIKDWIIKKMAYLDSNWDYNTAVEFVTETTKNNEQRYNLLGIPVDENYKGIVIINGRKHIQK